MTDFSENETPMTSCDTLLIQSIRIYQEMETLYHSMQNSFSNTSVPKAQATAVNINNLLQDAINTDSLIAECLNTNISLPESTRDLIGKREELLSRLYQVNKRVTAKADNVKALLRHEINGMSTNRHAMKGYKPIVDETQSIVRNFF
jgi:hypothetical protein